MPPSNAKRFRWSIPLLGRVVIALIAVGLVPFLISTYQIRSGEAAMIDQAQKTHLVSAVATAERISAHVKLLQSLARAVAVQPTVVADPASPEAEENLAGILQARGDVVAAGVYLDRADPQRATRPVSEPVRVARRSDYRRSIDAALSEIDARPLATVTVGDETWLRIRVPLEGRSELFVLLLARMVELQTAIRPDEIGEQAEMVLTNRNSEVLLGSIADFEGLSPVMREVAGRTASGVDRVTSDNGAPLIVATATVPGTPWHVFSRQPQAAAAQAAGRQRTVARRAFALVLGVMTLIALWAQRAIVAPIRRLVRAQRRLVGGSALQGDEIAQLEQAFAELEENLHDREALGRIFLGRYQVVDVLGVGAMGTVFRGWDPRLERAVALKTVKIGAASSAAGTRGETPAEQLVREAVTLARLNHPNIVTVYDVQSQGDKAFLAMELVEGTSLERWSWRQNGLPLDEATAIGNALFAALNAAHGHGVIHHDVKPANVLLGEDGAIKVTDFGISELVNAHATEQEIVFGTPGYLAPEALTGKGYTASSDLFAAGVVLYQILAGIRPFAGTTSRQLLVSTLADDPEPLSSRRPDVPAALEAMIHALLAKAPDDRPADAATAAAAFAEATRDHVPAKPFRFVLEPIDGESDEPTRPHTSLVPTRRIA